MSSGHGQLDYKSDDVTAPLFFLCSAAPLLSLSLSLSLCVFSIPVHCQLQHLHSIPASIDSLFSPIALCFPAPLERSFRPSAHPSASAVSPHPQHQLLPFTSNNSNPSRRHSPEQSARDSTHLLLSARVSNPTPPTHQLPRRAKTSLEQQPTSQTRRH